MSLSLVCRQIYFDYFFIRFQNESHSTSKDIVVFPILSCKRSPANQSDMIRLRSSGCGRLCSTLKCYDSRFGEKRTIFIFYFLSNNENTRKVLIFLYTSELHYDGRCTLFKYKHTRFRVVTARSDRVSKHLM